MKTYRILCAVWAALALALPVAGQQEQPEIQRLEQMLQAAPAGADLAEVVILEVPAD